MNPSPGIAATSTDPPASSIATPQESPPQERPSLLRYLRRLGPAGVLAVLASTLPPLGSIVVFTNIKSISEWLRSQTTDGPMIFASAFVFLGGFALLPTYATAALAGWAFGFQRGTLAVMAGILGAALLAFTIARYASRDRAIKILNERPDSRAVYHALLGGSFLKTLGIVTLVRLPPNSPFALGNLLLAAAGVRVSVYLLGTFLGMLPRTALAVWISSTLEGDFAAKSPQWIIWVSIAVGAVVVLVIGRIAGNALRKIHGKSPDVVAADAP